MIETGWCGFGAGGGRDGVVVCAGVLRITVCAGRIGDRIAGYDATLAAAREAVGRTTEQRAREAGL